MGEVIEWGMRVPFASPQIGEAEKRAVLDVLSQSILTDGPKTAEFEERFRDFCGAGGAVAVTSCTAALHLAWIALIRPGDEVIVPALTHPATAMAVEAAGGVVRFSDVGEDGNMTPDLLYSAMTPKTKGVCVVHFLGRPAPMQALMNVCPQPFVEDCALALGSYIGDRHVGLFGSAGCFSFYPCKHMTTCEGGMILSTNNKLLKEVKSRRTFGRHKDLEGHIDFLEWGINYRMSEISAAIGVEQIKRLENILTARKKNAYTLLEAFGKRAIGSHYAVSYLASSKSKADKIFRALRTKSIEASKYYAQPLHEVAYFKAKYGKHSFPNAEEISGTSVTLPVGPHVTAEKIKVMIELIREVD